VAEPEPDLDISSMEVWPELNRRQQSMPKPDPDPVSSQDVKIPAKKEHKVKKITKSALQMAASHHQPETAPHNKDDFGDVDALILDVEEQISEGTTMMKGLTTNDEDMAEAWQDGKKRGHDEAIQPSKKEGNLIVVTKYRLAKAVGDLSGAIPEFHEWLHGHPAEQHLDLVNQVLRDNLSKLSEEQQLSLTFLPIDNQIKMMLHLLSKNSENSGTK
jgi:hypothetical protein